MNILELQNRIIWHFHSLLIDRAELEVSTESVFGIEGAQAVVADVLSMFVPRCGEKQAVYICD